MNISSVVFSKKLKINPGRRLGRLFSTTLFMYEISKLDSKFERSQKHYKINHV